MNALPQPWVEIVEQPKQNSFRFRYECEGRSAGSIPGKRSTADNKTYPKIKIHNGTGWDKVSVVVSCVSKDDSPPKPHPNSLVGKDCHDGVCKVDLNSDMHVFMQLGIQCARKKDKKDNLIKRQQLKIDPFCTGFDLDVNNIDTSSVRLAFQVLYQVNNEWFAGQPAASDCIVDHKCVSDFNIVRVSSCSASAQGGEELLLFCDKVNKDNIQVVFQERDSDDCVIWEGLGDFGPSDVHKQYGIAFKVPPYKKKDIDKEVEVKLMLRETNSGEPGKALNFIYKPLNADPHEIDIKRRRKVPIGIHYTDDRIAIKEEHQNVIGKLRDKVCPSTSTQVTQLIGDQNLINENNQEFYVNIPNDYTLNSSSLFFNQIDNCIPPTLMNDQMLYSNNEFIQFAQPNDLSNSSIPVNFPISTESPFQSLFCVNADSFTGSSNVCDILDLEKNLDSGELNQLRS